MNGLLAAATVTDGTVVGRSSAHSGMLGNVALVMLVVIVAVFTVVLMMWRMVQGMINSLVGAGAGLIGVMALLIVLFVPVALVTGLSMSNGWLFMSL